MQSQTRFFVLASIIACCLSLQPARAADEKGLYHTLYFISCETYSKDRKEPANTGKNAVDMIYVSGWLSGYNYITPNTYDIIPDRNINSVMAWLDKFCTANPKQNIEVALFKLTDDLYPKRIKSYQDVQAAKAAAKPADKKP